MINFNKDSAFDLKPIPIAEVRDEVNGLLIAGEEIACAFKTIRDQLIFTNKRIIPLTCRASPETEIVQLHALSKVQFFAIQTPGLVELIPDSELVLTFSNGFTAKFEFKGDTDIGKIGRMISEYVLK